MLSCSLRKQAGIWMWWVQSTALWRPGTLHVFLGRCKSWSSHLKFVKAALSVLLLSFSESWRLKEWSTDPLLAKSCVISPLWSIRTLWWLFHSWLTYMSTSQHLTWKASLVSRGASMAFPSQSWHPALGLLFPDCNQLGTALSFVVSNPSAEAYSSVKGHFVFSSRTTMAR